MLFTCNYNIRLYLQAKNTKIFQRVNVFFYDDNSGFQSAFGKMEIEGKKHTIDNDNFFIYNETDKNGTYTVEYNKTVKNMMTTHRITHGVTLGIKPLSIT